MTNGINIYNADGSIMENGDYINPGVINDDYAVSGYPEMQGAVFLPTPALPGSYHLFHVGIDDTNEYGATGMKFYYSVLERHLADSTYYVSSKNQIILSDTLGVGYITATKHANGRDWWLIMPRIASNKYRVYLLDPGGVSLKHEQNIGFVTDWRDWSGQSVISPDGSKYIRFDPFNRLNIFDFDRCTGLLSNPLHLAHPFAAADSMVAGGVSVSPNSRYLYLSAAAWVYQYDLAASDVGASRIIVGEYDGTVMPLPTTFFRAQLAPDGKIYMNATNSNLSLHTIHQPDLPGLACMFENNAVVVENYIFWGSMPYFPNYRLGALTGSLCDSLSGIVPPKANFSWQIADTLHPLTVKFSDISTHAPLRIWDFGDGQSSQDSCPVHTYSSDGVYQVCLKVQNQQFQDSLCQTLHLKTTGLLEDDWVYDWRIYPNPANQWLYVWAPNGFQQHQTLAVFNTLQECVLRLTEPEALQKIDLQSFEAGWYYVVLTDGIHQLGVKSFVVIK